MRQASAETFARLQDVEHELGLMRDRCATLEDALERKHADHHSMLQSTDSATADLRAECDRLRAQLLDARAMQAKERELAKSMQDQLRKALAAAQKARKSAGACRARACACACRTRTGRASRASARASDDRLQELLHRRAAVAAAEDGAYEALGASQRRASGSGGGADDSLVGV